MIIFTIIWYHLMNMILTAIGNWFFLISTIFYILIIALLFYRTITKYFIDGNVKKILPFISNIALSTIFYLLIDAKGIIMPAVVIFAVIELILLVIEFFVLAKAYPGTAVLRTLFLGFASDILAFQVFLLVESAVALVILVVLVVVFAIAAYNL